MKTKLLIVASLFVAACGSEKKLPTVSTPTTTETQQTATNPTQPPPPVVDQPAPPPPPSPPPVDCGNTRDNMPVGLSGDGMEATFRNSGPCENKAVYVAFKRNSDDFFDQTLVEMVGSAIAPHASLTLRLPSLPECYQVDAYGGITIDDIKSGRVKIHPKEEKERNWITPLATRLGEHGDGCQPPPPPKECELILTKSVTSDQSGSGDDETKPASVALFTIDFLNIGTAACVGGGVKITDRLDDSFEFAWSESHSPGVDKGYGSTPFFHDGVLTWNANEVEPGQSGWVKFKVKVRKAGKNKAKAGAQTRGQNVWLTFWSNTVYVDAGEK